MHSSDSARRPAATGRIIASEALAAAAQVKRFDIGALGGRAASAEDITQRRRPSTNAAEETQAAVRAQIEAAYQRGQQAGYEAARREADQTFAAFSAQQAAEQAQCLQALAQRFEAIGERYAAQLDGLERALAAQVIDVAVALARQTVRSAVALRPERIVPVVQQALAALVDEQARPVVHLHPDDLEPVRAQLGETLARCGGSLLADGALSPGDCLVRTSTGAVDATVAKRWQRALSAIGRVEGWIE